MLTPDNICCLILQVLSILEQLSRSLDTWQEEQPVAAGLTAKARGIRGIFKGGQKNRRTTDVAVVQAVPEGSGVGLLQATSSSAVAALRAATEGVCPSLQQIQMGMSLHLLQYSFIDSMAPNMETLPSASSDS